MAAVLRRVGFSPVFVIRLFWLKVKHLWLVVTPLLHGAHWHGVHVIGGGMRRMRGKGGCCVAEGWIFTSVHHKAVLVESKAPVARCNPPPPWRTLAWSTCNRRRHALDEGQGWLLCCGGLDFHQCSS